MNEVDLSPAEQEGIGSMEGDEKIVHSEGPTTVNLTAPLRCRRSGARWPRPPPHRCKYRHALYKPRDPHRADARPCTRTPSGARARHRVHAQAIVCTDISSCARVRHRVHRHGNCVHAHVIACADMGQLRVRARHLACTRTPFCARMDTREKACLTETCVQTHRRIRKHTDTHTITHRATHSKLVKEQGQ